MRGCEMITETGMYWLTRLDAIRDLLELFMFISGATVFVTAVLTSVEDGNDKRTSAVAIFLALFVFVASCAVRTFTPSTREMCAIVVVPKIANNEKLEQFGDKAYNLAIEWMDELNPKKNGGAK